MNCVFCQKEITEKKIHYTNLSVPPLKQGLSADGRPGEHSAAVLSKLHKNFGIGRLQSLDCLYNLVRIF